MSGFTFNRVLRSCTFKKTSLKNPFSSGRHCHGNTIVLIQRRSIGNWITEWLFKIVYQLPHGTSFLHLQKVQGAFLQVHFFTAHWFSALFARLVRWISLSLSWHWDFFSVHLGTFTPTCSGLHCTSIFMWNVFLSVPHTACSQIAQKNEWQWL